MRLKARARLGEDMSARKNKRIPLTSLNKPDAVVRKRRSDHGLNSAMAQAATKPGGDCRG